MKILKKIALITLTVIIVLGVGGYIYFNKKFSPPKNYLTIENTAKEVPIRWVANEISDISAMLLPVKISGIPETMYMQFDLGSTYTMFYSKPLKSLHSKYSKNIKFQEETDEVDLVIEMAEMKISSDKFRLLDFGEAIDWDNKKTLKIIGTIGTDLLEKRTVTLDFENRNCSFRSSFSDAELSNFSDFNFNKRRILLPATIDQEELNLLYDSGTSAFELVTNQESWLAYGDENGKITTSAGNSWGNTLTVKTRPANKQIDIGNKRLKLSEVTYIEGTSATQNMLMRLSGMEGMIGNKLFINQKVILDCKNEKFKVE
ncbi:hypothetical protein [Roseivirga misakiensis]|uniref:Peptidase A2 domain-containing protein n=1 Tax=Roseivirga misakiensis TaxID=1563681 RepID=A0A1E5SZ04_9BACT|nr:hypothetical protein [Roseivirga misakiensis]OEK04345.1 hypothetical protein BFP71_12750 [Roseivirga misakiensis]